MGFCNISFVVISSLPILKDLISLSCYFLLVVGLIIHMFSIILNLWAMLNLCIVNPFIFLLLFLPTSLLIMSCVFLIGIPWICIDINLFLKVWWFLIILLYHLMFKVTCIFYLSQTSPSLWPFFPGLFFSLITFFGGDEPNLPFKWPLIWPIFHYCSSSYYTTFFPYQCWLVFS